MFSSRVVTAGSLAVTGSGAGSVVPLRGRPEGLPRAAGTGGGAVRRDPGLPTRAASEDGRELRLALDDVLFLIARDRRPAPLRLVQRQPTS
ncbi:hypothetical protein [Streptomyces hokutonensis]|uniref:hypothetical protein n=1 Tax=Streptomyces hokutonensis TaxID=1306990 RepID=UPI0038193853